MFLLSGAELRAVDDRSLEKLLARAEMTVAARGFSPSASRSEDLSAFLNRRGAPKT